MRDILNEREKTHGNFPTQAVTSQALKDIIRQAPNWEKLPAHMKESLDLIATKQSRILHGNFNFQDSWADIVGYAELVEMTLD
jgi:hypothetical protein